MRYSLSFWRWGGLPLCVWAWCIVLGQAETLVIDDFADPDPAEHFFITATTGGSTYATQHAAPESHVLGGEREIVVAVNDADPSHPPLPTSASGIFGFDEVFGISVLQIATSPGPGATVTLTYDGSDAEPMLADLTDGGTNRGFVLRFNSSDGGDDSWLDVRIAATNPAVGTASLREPHLVADNNGPFDYFLPFTDFDVADAGLFFQQVDQVVFTLNGDNTPNADFELDLVATIPEPSTVVLGGCGGILLVFWGLFRRKRQTAPGS
ncbi:MAG: hypothetical protein JXB62_07915 [Pirellulales bacterium]|nr:hypothetical protein [Pirellulales bacterium]